MSRSPAAILAALLGIASAVAAAAPAAPAPTPLSGVVRSRTGVPVAGARVTLEEGARPGRAATTDARGRFSFPDPTWEAGAVFVSVSADGFAPARVEFPAEMAGAEVEISLTPSEPATTVPGSPASDNSVPGGPVSGIASGVPGVPGVRGARIAEDVTVTAARTPRAVRDTPASVIVLDARDLAVTAAPAADDALRQATGFSLFRRSGSRTSNPTTQGVSLRGTGASGASRAAVLEDGVPVNDAFGGWVWWGRISLLALDRAEVVRGGLSELWGSPALGGAVQLVRRSPAGPASLDADASWGSRDSRDGSVFGSFQKGAWGATLSGEAYATAGYVPVKAVQRGPVDASASSSHGAADLLVERRGPGARLYARAGVYDESRENGTPLQTNDVRLAQGSLGAEWTALAAAWTLRAWGNTERFHQTFSAIFADRSTERLTRLQTVPADALGASAQAVRAIGQHLLVAGIQASRVKGESREEAPGAAPSFSTAGGEESSAAAFVEDVFTPAADWTWTAGVRADAWRNRDGRSDSSGGAGTPPPPSSVRRFPDRSETSWSPRLSSLYRAGETISFAASAWRSFRAPTLNELYRSFRVGNVATSANETLLPERSTGAELAAIAGPAGGRIHGRATLFWMEIEDAIGNRTLSSTPALVSRRRENIGTTRSRGVELDADATYRHWTLSGGYLFADSTVLSAPAAPALAGRRVPQVPRHQATLRIAYRSGGFSAAVQARAGSAQLEDDGNQLRLAPYGTADVFVTRAFGNGLEPYLAVENLFDRDVEIGRTPVTTLGAPREIRFGIRVRLSK